MSDNQDPILLKAGLDKLMKSIGAPDIDSTVNLLEIWPELIGEDPAWSSQISWLEAQILERIDEKIGKNVVTAVKAKTVISKKTD